MLVYSKKIIKFIDEIKNTIKDVISNEVGLRVHSDLFYDRSNEYAYRIKVVIYNDKKMLGYFDSDFYELGFHELLMHSSKEKLRNIIRHELAHYITFINYKYPIQAHGPEFRALCYRMGWGEEVYLATTCLDDGANIDAVEENSVLRKVQKLMALSSSSNENEAEQAMIKSRQLLLKHNIDSTYFKDDRNSFDEKVYLKRILKQKKKMQKCIQLVQFCKLFL